MFLAFMQWLEMHESGKQTDRIIAADERIASAMEQSLGQSQKAFDATTKQAILAERAWLNVYMDSEQGDGKSKFDANLPFFTRITIKNVGKTSALNVQAAVLRRVTPGERFGSVKSPDFAFGREYYKPNGTIPPDGTFFADFDVRDLPQAVGEAIKGMETRIYFYGRVEYKDAFGADHWVTFCRFLLPGGAYQICNENNDIDRNAN